MTRLTKKRKRIIIEQFKAGATMEYIAVTLRLDLFQIEETLRAEMNGVKL